MIEQFDLYLLITKDFFLHLPECSKLVELLDKKKGEIIINKKL